jgi:hypothetical protein
MKKIFGALAALIWGIQAAAAEDLAALQRQTLQIADQQLALAAQADSVRPAIDAVAAQQAKDWQAAMDLAELRISDASSRLTIEEKNKLQRWLSWSQMVQSELATSAADAALSKAKPERNKALLGEASNDLGVYFAQDGACESAIALPTPTLSAALPSFTAGVRLNANQAQWFSVETRIDAAINLSTVGSEVDTKLTIWDACPNAGGKILSAHDDDLGLAELHTIKASARAKRILVQLESTQSGTAQIQSLRANGLIRGIITRPQGATDGVTVYAYRVTATGYALVAQTFASQGSYQISAVPETYIVLAVPSNSNMFLLGRAYPNVPCFRPGVLCDAAQAERIVLGDGQTVSGINMRLTEGAIIAGRLQTYVPPILGQSPFDVVRIRVPEQNFEHTSRMDAAGRYAFKGLPPGRYFAEISAIDYELQVYQNQPCVLVNSQCDLSNARPIELSDGAQALNVDFSANRLFAAFGTIAGPDGPIQNAVVRFYSAEGTYLRESATDGRGRYSIALGSGSFFALVEASGFRRTLYDDINCNLSSGCTITQGTPIVISTQDRQIDITLPQLGRITGTVSDDLGAPIENANVILCVPSNNCGSLGGSARTSSNGVFELRGLLAGTYYVLARSDRHIDQAYPNVDCQLPNNQSCQPSLAGAQAITVTDNQIISNINFQLPRAGSISGSLGDNLGFLSGAIYTYKTGLTSGPYSTDFDLDSAGNYIVNDLEAGEYRMLANFSSYFSQVYPNQNCVLESGGCNILAGELIDVSLGQNVLNKDFNLINRYVISGQVTDADTNAPLASVAIDLWKIAFISGPPNASTVTDAQGRYTIASVDNTFNSRVYVSTDAPQPYQNAIHADVVCQPGTSAFAGTCSFASALGVQLPATAPGSVGPVNFMLRRSVVLFSNGFE